MGLKLKIATLILALCFPASVGEILQLDHLQGNMKHEIICGSGVADPNKFSRASGARPETVAGGHQPSEVHGGAATIPLNAAGAAAAGAASDHRNNHRNHNGSNRNRNGVEFVTLAFTILACLLLRQNI